MKKTVALCAISLAIGTSASAEGEQFWKSPSVGPLTPSVHLNAAVGDSSGDPEALAVGHHDPSREDGSVQGIELGLSLRLEKLEGFATHNFSYGAEEEWGNEWEEAFLKLKDLSGGFELRGGRALARFGRRNSQHLHSWDFVDKPLVLGRFLGDDGLILDGGDVTWLKRDIDRLYGATVAYGEPKTHDHDHGHGEHEHIDVVLQDDVTAGRLFAQYRRDDFNTFDAGVSVAVGDADSGAGVAVYGADFSYEWRENGAEPGGRSLKWITEVLYRDVDDAEMNEEHEEHDHEAGHEGEHEHAMLSGGSEFGVYGELIYTLDSALDLAARIGYVEGNDDFGAEERTRVSPAVTVHLDPDQMASLRLQYNYDNLPDEEEHSVWLQLGLSWGGPEVR